MHGTDVDTGVWHVTRRTLGTKGSPLSLRGTKGSSTQGSRSLASHELEPCVLLRSGLTAARARADQLERQAATGSDFELWLGPGTRRHEPGQCLNLNLKSGLRIIGHAEAEAH
eukprot:2272871-Rhodomonas_salina.1